MFCCFGKELVQLFRVVFELFLSLPFVFVHFNWFSSLVEIAVDKISDRQYHAIRVLQQYAQLRLPELDAEHR